MILDHNIAGVLLFAGIVVATFISEDGATALAAGEWLSSTRHCCL